MIDTLLNSLFRCSHRRITRPITPASKAGDRSNETYVVCLECGKQFLYDLDTMRVGKPVATSDRDAILPPSPSNGVKKVRYAALISLIPLTWFIRKWLKKP